MRSENNRPIGIFDSGVGGLTVAKSIRRQLPGEDIVYFGDSARVPYGNKSKSTITRFAREIMAFMMKSRVKLVVVACNTASSLCLPFLKKNYPVPVIGVIGPGAKEAARISKTRSIGVIGTSSTIASGSYERELLKAAGAYRLFVKPCPLFVPLVENRFINDTITYQVAERYLDGLKKKNIDTLILGCTHYPILKKVIDKVMDGVRLVDSSCAVAREVKSTLSEMGLDAGARVRGGRMSCYLSDDVEGFRAAAGIFLKEKVSVKKVTL